MNDPDVFITADRKARYIVNLRLSPPLPVWGVWRDPSDETHRGALFTGTEAECQAEAKRLAEQESK